MLIFFLALFNYLLSLFHLSDGQASGKILSLGVYDRDYGWEEEEEEDKIKEEEEEKRNEESEKKNPLKTSSSSSLETMKHHRQFYTNGTECELNGKQRKTEVRVRGKFIFLDDGLYFSKINLIFFFFSALLGVDSSSATRVPWWTRCSGLRSLSLATTS